jgi:hypothetical protein
MDFSEIHPENVLQPSSKLPAYHFSHFFDAHLMGSLRCSAAARKPSTWAMLLIWF